MSLLSMLNVHYDNGSEIKNQKVGFISYGSGSKAKIFQGIIQENWESKIKQLKLFEILDSRKKITISEYENLHRRKVSSNINNNKGVIKLVEINNGEFTEGLRSYLKY